MTYFIAQDAVSTLLNGVETIVIPIRDEHDLGSLVTTHSQRGKYGLVEWLLSQLNRPTEVERVCGLSIKEEGGRVVAQLELRQPGKQIEEWLQDISAHPTQELSAALRIIAGYFSVRALELDRKFSEKNPPWWLSQVTLPDE